MVHYWLLRNVLLLSESKARVSQSQLRLSFARVKKSDSSYQNWWSYISELSKLVVLLLRYLKSKLFPLNCHPAGGALVDEPLVDAEDEARGSQGEQEEQEQAGKQGADGRQEGAKGHPDARHRPR